MWLYKTKYKKVFKKKYTKITSFAVSSGGASVDELNTEYY